VALVVVEDKGIFVLVVVGVGVGAQVQLDFGETSLLPNIFVASLQSFLQ
jgi:hypothetical protein